MATEHPPKPQMNLISPDPTESGAVTPVRSTKSPSRDKSRAPQPPGPTPPGTRQSEPRKPSTKAFRQEFFIPVSGFVWLYPEEVQVVNHPSFQRLARVYQLGQAHLVYRGATHKRLEHVLGTLHVIQRMIDAVHHNSEKDPGNSPLNDWEARFVRLGALLHDIGHIAAGHTVEDELGLLGRHDEDSRLTRVFTGDQWRDQGGRTLASLIDELYSVYIPEELRNTDLSASVVVRLLIRKKPDGSADSLAPQQHLLETSDTFRLGICRDMIGNTICADLLDYLHRDWYHVGKPRPFDDRLLQYMEVRKGGAVPIAPSSKDKFVISLGKRPNLHTDAISNILELLEWRYQLAESVLFHKTKLAAAAMLDRALFELWEGTTEDVEGFLLPLSDEAMVMRCRERADTRMADEKGELQRGKVARDLLEKLENRQLFSHLCTRFYGDLPADVVGEIEKTYAGMNGDKAKAAKNRNRVLRVLEGDFGLPPGSLAMYCPGSVNEKIAMVKIAVGNEILPFAHYERKHNNLLSGGHLDAQLHRFRRLWRVHFFIERTVKKTLGDQLLLLQQAIEKLALGNLVDDESYHRVAHGLARSLTQMVDSPWQGATVLSEAISAAHRQAGVAIGSYPLGSESIRAYIRTADESRNAKAG